MTRIPQQLPPSRRPSGAFTLAETLISVLIVGGVLVAALHAAGASVVGQKAMTGRARAALLAGDLMAEIMAQAYTDSGANPAFGRELLESLVPRTSLDDVDDYHALVDSPPRTRTGIAIPGLDVDWRREVQVDFIDPDSLTTVVGSDAGAKRITVTVKHKDMPLAALIAVRTGSPDDGGGTGGGPVLE